MQRFALGGLVAKAICFFLLLYTNGYCDFGYISYSTGNIGDDIQALAAKRFLPEDSIPIDREFVGQFSHNGMVKTIVNGWYMHTKSFAWYRTDVPGPTISWPPSTSIDPLFISIHFTDGFLPTVLSDESVEYLKQHGPIGARDYPTLGALQRKGIPSYFSGCLTLTLENSCQERDDIVYAVDLDDECLCYLRSVVKSRIKVVHHGLRFLSLLNNTQRLNYAEKLLQKYSRAKCVVTTRLHASMPCLALKTPVFLIVEDENLRFSGLKELVRCCTKKNFLAGKFDFNFDEPSENPTAYIPLREKLIETVTNWVKKGEYAN
jgi:hypothetical protein